MTPSLVLLLVSPFSMMNRPRRTTMRGARSGCPTVALLPSSKKSRMRTPSESTSRIGVLPTPGFRRGVEADDRQRLGDANGRLDLDLRAPIGGHDRVRRGLINQPLQLRRVGVAGARRACTDSHNEKANRHHEKRGQNES